MLIDGKIEREDTDAAVRLRMVIETRELSAEDLHRWAIEIESGDAERVREVAFEIRRRLVIADRIERREMVARVEVESAVVGPTAVVHARWSKVLANVFTEVGMLAFPALRGSRRRGA